MRVYPQFNIADMDNRNGSLSKIVIFNSYMKLPDSMPTKQDVTMVFEGVSGSSFLPIESVSFGNLIFLILNKHPPL